MKTQWLKVTGFCRTPDRWWRLFRWWVWKWWRMRSDVAVLSPRIEWKTKWAAKECTKMIWGLGISCERASSYEAIYIFLFLFFFTNYITKMLQHATAFLPDFWTAKKLVLDLAWSVLVSETALKFLLPWRYLQFFGVASPSALVFESSAWLFPSCDLTFM